MRMWKTGTGLASLVVAGLAAAPATAAGPSGVAGRVMDASGAALPGVTVVASCPQSQALVTTMTNGHGEYYLEGLPAGSCAIGFHLDGFEASAVAAIAVHPDHTAVLNHELALASLAETIDVVARKPAEPDPAPPPLPVPAPVALPDHDPVTVCGPTMAVEHYEPLAYVVASRLDDLRLVHSKGDLLLLDGGTAVGLRVGDNLAVRRKFRTGALNARTKRSYTGEHTSGVVQVVAVREHSADAVVVYACDELVQGDYVAGFAPQIVPPLKPRGTPDFELSAHILFGDEGQSLGAPDRLMVIDRGSDKGVAPGERMTVFRRHRQQDSPLAVPRREKSRKADWPTYEVGEAVVVSVRPESSTIRIVHATEAIFFGDQVAPQR